MDDGTLGWVGNLLLKTLPYSFIPGLLRIRIALLTELESAGIEIKRSWPENTEP